MLAWRYRRRLPEDQSALSKYPLEWMATEAAAVGLLLDQDRLGEVLGLRGGEFMEASPEQPHPTLTCLWHLAEFVPKAR